jgi:hypothetical protein
VLFRTPGNRFSIKSFTCSTRGTWWANPAPCQPPSVQQQHQAARRHGVCSKSLLALSYHAPLKAWWAGALHLHGAGTPRRQGRSTALSCSLQAGALAAQPLQACLCLKSGRVAADNWDCLLLQQHPPQLVHGPTVREMQLHHSRQQLHCALDMLQDHMTHMQCVCASLTACSAWVSCLHALCSHPADRPGPF